jgi:hypothetical protein
MVCDYAPLGLRLGEIEDVILGTSPTSDKIEQIEADADTLIHNLGAGAYSAARRREHEATSEAMARH